MVVMMQLAWTQPLRTTSGEKLEPNTLKLDRVCVLCVPNPNRRVHPYILQLFSEVDYGALKPYPL